MCKKILFRLVLIVLFSLFTACEDKEAKLEKTETITNNAATKQAISAMKALSDNSATQQKVSFSENEFDIDYCGVTINADIPFENIAKELGIDIVTYGGISDSRTENYAVNIPYPWNIVHYPSKEN